MTLGNTLVHDVHVKLQVVSVLLVTAFVVAFELAIYLNGVVPIARSSLRSLLHGAAGVRRTNGVVAVDAALSLLEQRERRLVRTNNGAAVLRGVLIVVAPVLLVVLLFLSSARLRDAPLGHVLADVGCTVLLLGAFQGCFFMLGQQWAYPSVREMVAAITKQYREDCAADGEPDDPVVDPRIRQLYT